MAGPTATVRTNVLHDYANHTYNIQLYAITQGGFNKISQGAIAIGKESDIVSDGSLLISNGGVGNGEKRASEFPTDFVIDNLEIESLITGGGNRMAHNATNIKFTVTEPNGITLINNLYKSNDFLLNFSSMTFGRSKLT